MTSADPDLTHTALEALLDALSDAHHLLVLSHPALPLSELYLHIDFPERDVLLADTILLMIENLRAALTAYRREQALAAIFPLR